MENTKEYKELTIEVLQQVLLELKIESPKITKFGNLYQYKCKDFVLISTKQIIDQIDGRLY